ncbi:YodC family protein [Ectopseudomonas khazarica]|uniref:YodC family protein n=1 Tax=Ectopseudomonas khazarica TaxID=2502979 RepID=UPI004033A92D
MSEIQKGDVVQLKSGGPRMTVQDIGDYGFSGGPNDGALCVWFEKNKAEEKVFDLAVLVKSASASVSSL